VDIRTKLVFALVSLALGSMLTLGGFMYTSADRSLNASTENQLASLAESRKLAIEDIIAGWRERVQLIASRTQLRISLREYARSRDPEELARIRRILSDALGSVRTVQSLALFDTAGRPVTAVGEPVDDTLPDPPHIDRAHQGDEVEYLGTYFTPDGHPRVLFGTDLALDGERLGEVLVTLSGRELFDLTEDYTGLGETGEVLIVMRDQEGIRTLHAVRNPPGGSNGPVLLEEGLDAVVRALNGDEDVYPQGLTDYRGELVWAATRYIPETDWGVVVKFDEAEEQRVINKFRSDMITLALSLSAFAILFAVLLGIRLANPIQHLAEVANRIRGGELDARATVEREDEFGLLARTFNQMAETLEDRLVELHEFQKFFELSLDLLCIAGTDGYFKRVNPAFERTLGWSTEQLLSRPFLDLVHPEDIEATEREIAKLATGVPTVSFVNRFRCVDGSYKSLIWNSHPEPDGMLYAVAREITERPTES
jgi:PAS domain S-box-containing protein